MVVKQFRRIKMIQNKLLKAAISKYEAQRDEAKAHLHILFKNYL